MPIPISENLRQWLVSKNLQGYINVFEGEPHLNVAELLQQINISKITDKQVRRTLKLKREGFDVVQKMDKDTLRSYFREYSPSAKAFQMFGGQDEFFHEVATFMLEVGFVTAWFYGMPKKRVGFIIATYEGETFDCGLLLVEVLRDQLYGVQQKRKSMKTIFARWLSILFPPLEIGKSTRRKEAITSADTGATRRMAGNEIGTSRYHSTGKRTSTVGAFTSPGIGTKPSTRLCPHHTPNRTYSRTYTCRTNPTNTKAATGETKGSTISID